MSVASGVKTWVVHGACMLQALGLGLAAALGVKPVLAPSTNSLALGRVFVVGVKELTDPNWGNNPRTQTRTMPHVNTTRVREGDNSPN